MNEMVKMVMNSSLREIVREKPEDGKHHIMISFHGPDTEPQNEMLEVNKTEQAEEPVDGKIAWDDFPDLDPDTRPEDLTEKQKVHLMEFMFDMFGIQNSVSGNVGDEDDDDSDNEVDDDDEDLEDLRRQIMNEPDYDGSPIFIFSVPEDDDFEEEDEDEEDAIN